MRNKEIVLFYAGCLGLCLPFFLIAGAASTEMLVLCVSEALMLCVWPVYCLAISSAAAAE